MRALSRIAAGLLVLSLAATTAFAVLKTGDSLRPFSLKNVDGKEYMVTLEDGKLTLTVTDNSGGQAKVVKTHPAAVLIDFWATWCVPCRAAMPYMQKLHEKYSPAEAQDKGGLKLFGIALDDKGSKVVKPFYAKLQITYPMLADATTGISTDGILHTAMDMERAYGVQAIPVVYVFDAKGTIVHVHEGFKPEHITELEGAVRAAIGGGK